ncbi:tyrosine-type recombinase/integrase [Adhaeretor mobilis]|uniref:tyrosine-type recombinase/integrase n=1 Tax=Adhaeretor mobilis TaxID=1930276 RepID=UPI0011A37789
MLAWQSLLGLLGFLPDLSIRIKVSCSRSKHSRNKSSARLSPEWVGKVISEIGKRAGVVVQPASGAKAAKFASAHDLRRSCADRLISSGVPEREVAAVMRHASVETTRRHYAPSKVQRSAGVIREKLSTVPRYTENEESTQVEYTPEDSNLQPSDS